MEVIYGNVDVSFRTILALNTFGLCAVAIDGRDELDVG